MTPSEFKAAQHALGLSDVDLSFVLDLDENTVRRYKRDPRHASARNPHPSVGQAMRWMTEDNYEPPRLRWIMSGHKPSEWRESRHG